MIQIQRQLIKPTFTERFYMKVGNNKSEKISKAKYEELYNDSWRTGSEIVVLAPITKELR